MEVGKVPENILKRTVFNNLKIKRDEVLYGPSIGEDCSVLRFDKDDLVVLSTDPITGTTEDIGELAVIVTVNDLASSGAEPVGIMLSLLLPEETEEEALKAIMEDVNRTCESMNIQLLGGHTEVTRAVTQPLVTLTGVGKAKQETLTQTGSAKPGQSIVMTKWAGVEGTAIIAKAKEAELRKRFNGPLIDRAKELSRHLSVLKESMVGVRMGVKAMHDVTEGGVFGALWELAACSGVGLEVMLDAIPVRQETVEICEFYNLNPYQLISSGSMLMVADDGQALVKALEAEGIAAAVIGKTTAENQKNVITSDTVRSLYPPQSDELYKVL